MCRGGPVPPTLRPMVAKPNGRRAGGGCEDGVLRRIRMHGMRANADRLRPGTLRRTAHRLSVLTASRTGGVRAGSGPYGCTAVLCIV
eukprot:scaffold20861_cov54-Phaeocystis_antarctica.AAC.5